MRIVPIRIVPRVDFCQDAHIKIIYLSEITINDLPMIFFHFR